MTNETVVGVVVGVTVGIVAAHIGSKLVRDVTKQLHEEELEETRVNAFQDGWRAASTNASNIRNRFKEMTRSDDELEGAAFKG